MQLRHLLAVTALPMAAFAGSAKEPVPTQPLAADCSFCSSNSLTEYFLGKDNAWDSLYDSFQQWKKDSHLPIGFGADHWYHIDAGNRIYGNGYGTPGERGTYYYYLNVDPSIKLGDDGFVKEVGIHAQGRIRDTDDKLRAFYTDTAWMYEAYAYAKTDLGTFKVGQIVEEFCTAWDYTWYEGVAYFDEYRFNPSYGITWSNSWKASDSFVVDTSAQYFLRSDHVSGGIVDSSAATTPGAKERNTGMLRVVPTWKLDADTKLAWGVAGLVREIDAPAALGLSDTQTAWDTDLTLTYKNWTMWGQYIDSNGVITPTRYVSGGPSAGQRSFSTGINYKCGPISAHVNYSKEWDINPGGHQDIFAPGLAFQIAKNVTLYAEYVKWNVTDSVGVKSKYDNGIELALVWNF